MPYFCDAPPKIFAIREEEHHRVKGAITTKTRAHPRPEETL
jgi:hypothetical protein